MDRFAETDLRQVVEIGLDHAGDTRVTAGGLRIGHQHDRLAVVRHLHHAGQQAVRQHLSVGGALQRRAAVQAVAHAVALRAELPCGAPERVLRLFAELSVLRPRQCADAVGEQQLLHATAVLRQRVGFAQRQPIAVLQITAFVAAKGGFHVGAARAQHFRHGDAARDRR